MRNLFLALFCLLTFSGLAFAMNFLSETKEPDFDAGWEIAYRNRLYAPFVWYYEFSNHMNWNDENTRKLYEARVSIHHLAGNAVHLWYMYNDKEYRDSVKAIEKSHKNSYLNPYGVIEGRNSKADFTDIIEHLTKIENAVKDFKHLYVEIKILEKELSPYRTQRKLSYHNKEKFYHDLGALDYDSGPDFD